MEPAYTDETKTEVLRDANGNILYAAKLQAYSPLGHMGTVYPGMSDKEAFEAFCIANPHIFPDGPVDPNRGAGPMRRAIERGEIAYYPVLNTPENIKNAQEITQDISKNILDLILKAK